MHVIAIASQKGGVGKTTISLNLGLALARAGNRTLIMELDAQGSLGLSLGLADRARPGIAEVLTGAEPLEAVLTRTRDPQLHVLCVGRVDPTTVSGFEDVLSRAGVIQGYRAQLNPAALGNPDNRPYIADSLTSVAKVGGGKVTLGNLMNEFDFTQTPLPALVLSTKIPGGLRAICNASYAPSCTSTTVKLSWEALGANVGAPTYHVTRDGVALAEGFNEVLKGPMSEPERALTPNRHVCLSMQLPLNG